MSFAFGAADKIKRQIRKDVNPDPDIDHQMYPDTADAMRNTAKDLTDSIAKANTHCGINSC